jgi:hypothetical protein
MELRNGKSLLEVLHNPPRPIRIITPESQREKGRKWQYSQYNIYNVVNVNKAINDNI